MKQVLPLAAAAVAATSLALPGVAGAAKPERDGKPSAPVTRGSADCETELVDSSGFLWDLAVDGSVFDGGTPDESSDDAYDGLGFLILTADGDESDYAFYEPTGACTTEEGGREVVYPVQQDVGGFGVDVQRKVFVPSAGTPFARWLDTISNPGTEDVTLNYDWEGGYGEIDRVTDSADGDQTVDIGERWASFDQFGDDQTDQASLWDGAGDVDRWDAVYDDGDTPGTFEWDIADYVYESVTIPAGGSVTFLHVEHQNRTPEGARSWARANAFGNEQFFADLTAEERAALQNWIPAVLEAPAEDDGDSSGGGGDDDADAPVLPPTPPAAPQASLQLPDLLSRTAVTGTRRTATASPSGAFVVPGMTEICGVGPCQVLERAYTARRARAATHDRGRRHGLLARERHVLAAGRSSAVRMRLSQAANRRLRRAGRLRVEALVRVTDARGRWQLARRTITVRPAR